ncbi:MAG TPA: hypothetical protein VLW44_01655 [Streptosporangiaceae bacterium]|nr:hypothetical protein [Streptosporangiaceae bacterium]
MRVFTVAVRVLVACSRVASKIRSASRVSPVRGWAGSRAYHDGADLGGPAMARIARDYGYTLDELRKL